VLFIVKSTLNPEFFSINLIKGTLAPKIASIHLSLAKFLKDEESSKILNNLIGSSERAFGNERTKSRSDSPSQSELPAEPVISKEYFQYFSSSDSSQLMTYLISLMHLSLRSICL